jgi:hypothetical protein
VKRNRDDKGKFSTQVPSSEPPVVLTDVFSQPEPTAADLDRHQANVEAENQARMDTEKKQAVEAAQGEWNPPSGYSLRDVGSSKSTQSKKSGPYFEIINKPYVTAIAFTFSSLAIISILGTLWAVYYILRPKLDIHVTVQAPETIALKDPVIQNVGPKSDGMDFGAGAAEHRVRITAKEDVWVSINIDKNQIVNGGNFKSGGGFGYNLEPSTVVFIRAGKPNALKIELDGAEIHPENKYHGGGNLAEYVLDGKELLTGK